ncbi:trafficking protein particle complex [Seminavis robusta]|uniref:Trafficking protein particle complex n=1 Tax=Seminavis robusta TaxID=568900 RepID=A0A9N8DSV2_9STRA|nr:trafficking protein particle complex [Seminavis robusta]|eukprot:Sro331_g119060.1 trafficking protein particle complex (176) ;mRNA; f:20153-20769
MTILCLAIVGKNNEPLYLCDCDFDKENKEDSAVNEDDDIFGFASETTKGAESALSLDNEFLMYAALDYLEEALGIHPGLPSRRQTGSHWIGYLCPMGDAKCYGYATATNAKFIAMATNDVSESKLKILFNSLHDLYVKHTMNPFSKIGGKIVSSQKFSQGVKDAVAEYKKSINQT